MSDSIEAFPLAWPAGWRRSSSRSRAKFGNAGKGGWADGMWQGKQALTVAQATDRVLHQLELMGVSRHLVVISTNVELRRDGLPYSGRRAPDDPGACVYWQRDSKPQCMPIDRYDRVQDNLAAIAATLDAMRAIERHGGATILDRAFQGFVALPAPRAWWQVLELPGPNPTRAQLDAAHRRLISKHHPDKGGDTEIAADINAARDQGLEAIR